MPLDWAEFNGTVDTARNLHRLVGEQTLAGLSLHDGQDQDWFRLFAEPISGGSITVAYDSALGNVVNAVIWSRGPRLHCP